MHKSLLKQLLQFQVNSQILYAKKKKIHTGIPLTISIHEVLF